MRNLISFSFWGIRLASICLVAYWLLIFTGTHLPRVNLPTSFSLSDKVYHFVAYAGLSFLLCWALPKAKSSRFRHLWIAWSVALCYGIFDELTQLLVRGRSAEFMDFVADVFGASFGLLAYVIARRLIQAAGGFFAPAEQSSVAGTIEHQWQDSPIPAKDIA